jgi:hypothetical protein
MKRYTTVHPLFMSFYSKSLYRDVGKNWRNIAFLYLFLLSAVCLIPIMFRVHFSVSDYLHSEAPKIVKQVPVITIAGGVASVHEEMPYIIKDPESGAPLIIIDTTGKTTSLKGTGAMFLLTKSTLSFKGSSREARTLNLSEIGDLTIDQSQVYGWIETFLDYFIFVLYPFALLFTFLLRIVEALIFGAVGTFFAKRLGAPPGYRSLVSLAMVSMTPSVILDTLYNYLEILVPFWWVLNFVIAMGYLFFAVKANAEDEMPGTGV